jgi:hypothetical protein
MPNLQDFISTLFLSVNTILGICTIIDLTFHYMRGLGLWEKVSHPIDAFFITFCMFLGFYCLNWHSAKFFWIYCFVAFITLLLSYKDEFIHQKECTHQEQLIHAIMFSCIGISLALGAIMILLGIGKLLFLLAFLIGVIFFFVQIISNYFTKVPRLN